jgi:CheY-like chemotaxis protein
VLLVDDSPDTLDCLAIALRAAGLDVITARNGLEALIAAHTEHPSVIVMDIAMPVLNGIETARLLKAAPETRGMPVIAHTASPEIGRTQGSNLFAHVLPKPALVASLIALIERYVGAAV